MAQIPQKNILLGGIDVDTDEKRIQENRATFIKGLRYDINRNPSAGIGEGSNYGTNTPFEQGVEVTGLTYPAGNNYTVGSYQCKETNELYVFVYNSNEDHFIYRINGLNGTAELVYAGACLNFQIEPQYYISEGRCVLITDTYTDPVTKEEKTWKFLCFTDNYNPQRMISVEDSIVTDSFNAITYPYFAVSGYDCNPCYIINLGFGTPMRCIGIEPVARDEEEEKAKQNLLINNGWQWRTKHICHWGRESEHGVISDRYFTVIGAPCIQTSDSLPRCVKLTIDAGCPIVEKIQIEFRKCSGNSVDNVDSDWFLYDTLEKYNNCDDVPWYQREINAELDYNSDTNTFEYIFCGDKECQPIPVSETSRTQSLLALVSSSLFSIDKGIGLANNIRDFDKLDCDELDKVSFQVIPPVGGECFNDQRTIIVYAVIVNAFQQGVAGIRYYDGSKYNNKWPNGVVWGNSACGAAKGNSPQAYGQTFPDDQYGFIGYLAGTQFFCISEQYIYNTSNGQITKAPDKIPFQEGVPDGNYYIQKFTLKVPPGKYSFRIASQTATVDQQYQKTSTNVLGIVKSNNIGDVVSLDKEMIIDVCEDNFEDKENILRIMDLGYSGGGPECPLWARVINGYVYEDDTSKQPMELVVVDEVYPNTVLSGFTDHNGFFFSGRVGQINSVAINIDYCIDIVTRQYTVLDPTNLYSIDVYAMEPGIEYPPEGRREITGRFLLCDTDDVGVAGVSVVMKYAQYAYSDKTGSFKLIAHQRPSPYNATPDIILRTQRGGCIANDCDNPCQTCFDNIEIPYIPCDEPRNTELSPFFINIKGVGEKGLENGGRYGVGITMYDWMGRHGFIQANESHYLDIPALITTKKFSFSTIQWILNASIRFPDWVKYISFSITENLNNDDYLTWVIDKVEFVDDGGNVNKVNPTKIRIYYGSLAEYNLQNNFATNTNWEALTTDKTSVAGDFVEFITKNSNGDWFDTTITGLIRYSENGKYFDIDYSQTLSGLEEGALYKLVRPKACLTKYIYYEVCSTVRVVDGIPEAFTGTLNAFDSYFVTRQIPVPTEVKDANGDVTKTVTTKSYSYFFEHNSPSDFYGFKCANRGRINIKNPYERQKRLGSEVALSKAITNKGSFNGLSYFDTDDVTTFLEQEWGNIVVVMPEINTYLFICEHNNFVAGYKDTIVRIDENNQAIAPSATGAWGTPQRKIGSDYGCQFFDINTIRRHEGIVIFMDRQRYALLFHNFSDIKNVEINGYASYLMKKLATQNGANIQPIRSHEYRAHAGIDAYGKEYYLTFWGRPIGDNMTLYFNNLSDYNLDANETLCISADTGMFKCMTHFTPEYYGTLEGYVSRKNMYSFKNAHPWSHRSSGTLFNNFYGQQGKKVVQIVTNISPEKVKKFLYNEVYCKEHKFIIESIITESGQTSRLKAPWWDNREKFWCAEFLCALNTFQDPNLPILAIAALTDGDPLSGQWMKAKYISENADDAKYCELGAIVTYVTATDKSSD